MDLRHKGCGEDVAPYALGALPPAESRSFERHLDDCDLCRTDLATLRPVVDALPETVEAVPAPPELRKRIMTVVHEEAAQRRRSEREAARPVRRWSFRPLPVLAVACVLLVAGLGVGTVLNGTGSTVERPGTVASFPNASAVLEITDGEGRLVIDRMPNPPTERVWQVWLVRAGAAAPEPTDALFTTSRGGDAHVDVPGDLDDVEQVLVSHEPLGGSKAPTSAPVIAIDV